MALAALVAEKRISVVQLDAVNCVYYGNQIGQPLCSRAALTTNSLAPWLRRDAGESGVLMQKPTSPRDASSYCYVNRLLMTDG